MRCLTEDAEKLIRAEAYRQRRPILRPVQSDMEQYAGKAKAVVEWASAQPN